MKITLSFDSSLTKMKCLMSSLKVIVHFWLKSEIQDGRQDSHQNEALGKYFGMGT